MKTEQTLPNELVTANSEQLAVLKSNFPQCFDRQGKFILSKLQEILQANAVDVSRESYSLNWLGKSYARVLANEPIRTMLSEDYEHNQLEHNKNSHNLLIQGDNLEVLKHLKGAYTDKIKMIYIDPPYNTGSDGFVYQDDRSFTPEQFAELAGVDFDEAHRILDFTQSNANSHSAWLTFIYPRLYIAKQLLREDGVIFISIDDNEQAQLKILCDEVFGEQRFLGNLIWKRRASSAMAENNISIDHEYVIAYGKSEQSSFRGSKKNYNNYNNPDNDPRGDWVLGDLTVGMTSAMRPNQAYNLTDPNTGNVYPYNPNRVWSYIPSSMKELIDDGRVFFPKDPNKRPMLKRFKSELNSDVNPFSSLMLDKVGLNTEGTKTIQQLFNQNIFGYSKPLSLIKALISQVIHNDNEYVLDFFAGSGSTAHAVLEVNALNSKSIRFVCVQISETIKTTEQAFKAGYRTIFEITKDRIIKSGEKLVQDYPESNFERGFKIFSTCDNFLPEINTKQLTLNFDELAITPDAHQVDLNFTEKLVSNDFSESQLQDILTTWKGLDKILLSENLNLVNLGNYLAYGLGHVLYLVNKSFNTDALKVLIQKLDDEHEFQVSKLVILGHHFDSKAQREIDEAMKNYSNKKSIPVDVVVRY